MLGFGDDEAEYTTEPEGQATDPTTQSSGAGSDTTTSEESIFGLGIFYEGEPAPDAGAEDQQPARVDPHQPTEPERTDADANDHVTEPPTDPPEQQRTPAAADHTRPSSTGAVTAAADDTRTEGAGAGGEPNPRREPPDSPGRDTDHPAAGSGPAVYDTDGGASTGANEGTDEAAAAEAQDEGPADEEPPDEHRVDVEDDSGFIFG